MEITTQAFYDLILNRKGTTIFTIESITIPELSKPCTLGQIKKYAKTRIQTGFDWENAVNNARIKQNKKPIFEASLRQWGKVFKDRSFVHHNNNLYLRARVLEVMEITYFINNKQVPNSLVQPYLRKHHDPQPAITRNYKLSNVKRANLAGIAYELI